jgi:hypothetical protein
MECGRGVRRVPDQYSTSADFDFRRLTHSINDPAKDDPAPAASASLKYHWL